MSSPEARLAALAITLPPPPKPVAAYVPFTRVGNLVWVSGQIPFVDGVLMAKGAVPGQVSVEVAQQCARCCAINALSVLRDAAGGSLDPVRRIVRLGVWVCSEAGWYDQPKVANGASELMVEVFGPAGTHARAAVGSVSLPLGAPVEVEVLAELAS